MTAWAQGGATLVQRLRTTEREFADAPPLGSDVPLTVLTAESTRGLVPPALESWIEPYAPLFADVQSRLAQRSSNGIWRLVRGSEHLIASSRPQAVVDAVFETIRRR